MADALDAVGMTAVGVAWVRAMESARPDRLVDDPVAAVFVPDWASRGDMRGQSEEARRARIRMYLWIVARTVFLDNLCVSAAAEEISQFVILGVGLDARSFRLGFGDTRVRWFELDRAPVIDYREDALGKAGLAPRYPRTVVAADLAERWPEQLRGAGFDPTVPTLWLAEGLLVYLGAEVVHDVLMSVSDLSAPGSRLGCTVRGSGGSAAVDQGGAGDDPFRDVRTLWRETGDVETLLGSLGWTVDMTSGVRVLIDAGRLPASTELSPPTLLAARKA